MFRRQLGRELRALREHAGYTIEAAANKMEISRAKYGRIEHGMVSVRSLDVKQMCEIFGASKKLTDALMEVARKTRQKGWWHSFRNVMPETFDMYVGLETAAKELLQYDTELVPGLLQTEDYTTALIHADRPDLEEAVVEHRVALRQKRQRLLRRVDPPALEITAVLSEGILRRPVGGGQVMARQLAQLNKLGRLPNVSIRVIPFSAGLHLGVLSRSFEILRFLDATEPTTIHLDGYSGDLYLERPDGVARYEAAFADILSRSLDEKGSRDLIARAAEEYMR
ncbi:MAG: helix-turn-helix domain-containing protein [Micromonosporaceae bacterium]|nr:helix-turn-helix domain-containing protein [Micromonosporaceae bacterium]